MACDFFRKPVAIWLLAFILFGSADTAYAQELGGGAAPDISVLRIILALFVSLAIGVGAMLFLRARGRGGMPRSFQDILVLKKTEQGAIEIAQRQRLGPQSELLLIRARGREYLVLNGQAHALLIDSYAQDAGDTVGKDGA